MRLRPFREEDAPSLAALFHRSVREAGVRHYTPAQVAAWSPAPMDPAFFARYGADGRCVLIAADDADAPIAYGDVERSGHIDHLYACPAHVGKGVASQLYDGLEGQAHAWGLTRLFVEASEGAKPLFLRKGFSVLARNDLVRSGVPLHNWRMEKDLTHSPP